jgi:hypothetical protein
LSSPIGIIAGSNLNDTVEAREQVAEGGSYDAVRVVAALVQGVWLIGRAVGGNVLGRFRAYDLAHLSMQLEHQRIAPAQCNDQP